MKLTEKQYETLLNDYKTTKNKLSKKEDELKEFVKRVSHDLVAPIKSVQALIDITKMEEDADEKDKCLTMIQVSLKKQEEFIRRLMEKSRNYNDIQQEEIEIKKLCLEVIEDLKSILSEVMDKVCLNLEIADDFKIRSDEERISFILRNLISNAVKYYRRDEPKPYVKIKAWKNNENIFIQVSDNGEGIPGEYHERVFGMFERISEQSFGSGLGLHVVEQIVTELDGKIELESTPGMGSTFTVII